MKRALCLLLLVLPLCAEIPSYQKAYHGSTPVKKIMMGSFVVWEQATAITYELAWFPMDDENDGMILTDIVGGYDATLLEGTRNVNARRVEGKIGGAISFGVPNGSYDWASILNPILHYKMTASNWSLSWWGYTGLGTHSDWFNWPSGGSDAGEMYSYYNKDDSILFFYFFTPAGMPGISSGNYCGWNNNWYHWVLVREPTESRLYMNGTLKTVIAGDALQTFMSEFRIGGAQNSYSQPHHIDDFRLYDFSLNAEEVAFLYNGGNGTDQPLQVNRQVTKTDSPTFVIFSFYSDGYGLLQETAQRAIGRGYGGLPTPPPRESHVFQGWLDNGSLVSGNTLVTTIGDRTLEAYWVEQGGGGEVVVYSSYGWPSAYDIYYYDSNWSYFNVDGGLTFDGQVWRTTTPENVVYLYINDYNGGDVNYGGLPNLQGVTWYKYYDIYLNANGGYVDPTAIYGIYEGTQYENIGLPTPYQDGYNFEGWYSPNQGVIVGVGNYYSIYATETLDAMWSPQ